MSPANLKSNENGNSIKVNSQGQSPMWKWKVHPCKGVESVAQSQRPGAQRRNSKSSQIESKTRAPKVESKWLLAPLSSSQVHPRCDLAQHTGVPSEQGKRSHLGSKSLNDQEVKFNLLLLHTSTSSHGSGISTADKFRTGDCRVETSRLIVSGKSRCLLKHECGEFGNSQNHWQRIRSSRNHSFGWCCIFP